MSVFDSLGKLLFSQRLTETAIARALVAKGLSDAQGRAAIGSAASVAAGLRAIGLTVVADTVAVVPTLTLSSPTSYAVGAPVGTTQVATIGGLAAGETVASVDAPQLAVSGANIVKGLTESVAGSLPFIVTTSTGRTIGGTVVVTAAATFLGATVSSYPIAPTVLFHGQQSAKALRADHSFQGYISNGTSGTAGNILIVTSYSSAASRAIVEGMVLKTGASAGTKILYGQYNNGVNSGNGGPGRYFVNNAQAVGTSAAPVTFTVQADQVVSWGDLKGVADLTADATGYGPVVMTDGYGITYLRFMGGVNKMKSWLRNLTYNLNGGTDSHNIAWIMVARVHDTRAATPAYVGFGAKENTALANQANFPFRLGNWYGLPTAATSVNTAQNAAGASGLNRMFLGTQLQVLGSAVATDNGLNTPANVAMQGRVGLNEVSLPISLSSGTRVVNVPGFTLNASGAVAPSDTVDGGGGYIDLYELAGFLAGEFGTRAQMPARFDAAMAAAKANYSIPNITRRLMVGGDSRSVYGNGQAGLYSAGDGQQTAIFSILGERGYSYSLPADVNIVSHAFGGQGIGAANALIDTTAHQFNAVPSPLASIYQLGGGNDYFSFFMGSNDWGGGNAKWPSTTASNGLYAYNTPAIADDLFDGPGYTGTATATVAANGTALTTTGETGSIAGGSVITTAGWSPGAAVTGITSANNYALSNPSAVAHTSEAVSFQLLTYKQFMNKLLARGVKLVVGTETATVSSATTPDRTTTAGEFRYRILNDTLSATDAASGGANAGKVGVFDLTQVQIGGQYVIGYQGWQNGAGGYLADNIHMTQAGRRAAITGGDTPQYGYATAVKARLAA